MPPTEPISRRDRPAKPPLSRELIVRTGLEVLDRDGMAALTMRRVAEELDTGAASLYVYVRNREELLALMLDEAVAEVAAAAAGGSWRERLASLAAAQVEALARHPGLALVGFGRIPTGPNALLVTDRMLALLKEGGLDDRRAAWAVDLIGLHVTAAAADHTAYDAQAAAGVTESGYLQEVGAFLGALPAERYPMITALRGPLLEGGGQARAAWFLRVLVNGIADTPV